MVKTKIRHFLLFHGLYHEKLRNIFFSNSRHFLEIPVPCSAEKGGGHSIASDAVVPRLHVAVEGVQAGAVRRQTWILNCHICSKHRVNSYTFEV